MAITNDDDLTDGGKDGLTLVRRMREGAGGGEEIGDRINGYSPTHLEMEKSLKE